MFGVYAPRVIYYEIQPHVIRFIGFFTIGFR
jgi:hypothetical protein